MTIEKKLNFYGLFEISRDCQIGDKINLSSGGTFFDDTLYSLLVDVKDKDTVDVRSSITSVGSSADIPYPHPLTPTKVETLSKAEINERKLKGPRHFGVQTKVHWREDLN